MSCVWAVLLLGGGAAAQVRAVTSLAPRVVATVEAALADAAPEVAIAWERVPTAELMDAVLAEEAMRPCDLLAGVDAQVLELLAADRRLDPLGVEAPPGVVPFWSDPGGTFVVPWADAYVVVHDAGAVGSGVAPRTLEAMTAPRFADRLVVPEPAAAPALFVEWIRTPLRAGEPLDGIFAQLAALDSRVARWAPSAAAAVGALSRLPPGSFVVATRSEVAGRAELAFEPLEPFVPLQGLGIAIPAGGAAPAAAREAAGALLDPRIARALAAAHGILPGLADAGDGASAVPQHVRDLVAAAAPVAPERRWVRGWFRRFESDVAGRGRYSENLGLVLDVVFTLMFFAAMFWIYRRSQVAG